MLNLAWALIQLAAWVMLFFGTMTVFLALLLFPAVMWWLLIKSARAKAQG